MFTLPQLFDRHFYPQFSDRWDDRLFRERVLSLLRDQHTILDLGAGCGRLPEMSFHGCAGRVCGLDPDASVLSNPNLDEAKVGVAEKIPWPEATFDVVVSDNVFEHLPDPVCALKEVMRVLKPGGYFIAKTPNRFHYVPLAASLTPQWFHEWFNARRGRDKSDTFPTLYRANTRSRLRKLAHAVGFHIADLSTVEGRPEYLRSNPLMYAFGIAYERMVNATKLLTGVRVVILATFQAPGA